MSWPELFDMKAMAEAFEEIQQELKDLREEVAALKAAAAAQKYEITAPIGTWRPRNRRFIG